MACIRLTGWSSTAAKATGQHSYAKVRRGHERDIKGESASGMMAATRGKR
jgi:hypothetical protein